ncbi:MAG: hypothetical protein WC140_07590 [Bacteroidales bacterium]
MKTKLILSITAIILLFTSCGTSNYASKFEDGIYSRSEGSKIVNKNVDKTILKNLTSQTDTIYITNTKEMSVGTSSSGQKYIVLNNIEFNNLDGGAYENNFNIGSRWAYQYNYTFNSFLHPYYDWNYFNTWGSYYWNPYYSYNPFMHYRPWLDSWMFGPSFYGNSYANRNTRWSSPRINNKYYYPRESTEHQNNMNRTNSLIKVRENNTRNGIISGRSKNYNSTNVIRKSSDSKVINLQGRGSINTKRSTNNVYNESSRHSSYQGSSNSGSSNVGSSSTKSNGSSGSSGSNRTTGGGRSRK